MARHADLLEPQQPAFPSTSANRDEPLDKRGTNGDEADRDGLLLTVLQAETEEPI